jgi:methionyl-tRNA synthetase
METVLWTTAEAIRRVAILAQPFVPGSAAKLLDLLAVGAGNRQFEHVGEEHALAPGTVLPAPQPVFPRYVEQSEAGS